MTRSAMLAVLLLAAVANVEGLNLGKVNSAVAASANPIRKVTSLLKGIEKKVSEEIKAKEKLYDEYMCYCKTSDGSLAATIAGAEDKIPKVASSIEADSAKKAQTEMELKKAQIGRSEAKEQIAKAEKLRASQADTFASESGDLKTNIAALSKAIPAIESGMSGAFLQTSGAATLRRLTMSNIDISPSERDLLSSFLMVGQHDGYVPKSGEITGILKTIKDEMTAELADITEAEKGAISDFEGLVAAKKKEIASLTKAIETKSVLIGELGVSIAQQENDLENTKESLAEDQSFLANLDENCAAKTKEWEEFQKMSNGERVALADTIKMLTSDDSLELFKKTLPAAASFMQVQTTTKVVRQRALQSLSALKSNDPSFDFIQMALHGGQMGFDKIVKMIDALMAELKKDQADDDAKKAYCEDQFDIADDKKKGLEQDMSDLDAQISNGEETMSTLKSELADLTTEIKALDSQVAEATKARTEEHADFVETLAGNKAAKELLSFAMNRLNKFYRPNLYKAPPKVEVAVLSQSGVAPPPPPEADLGYKKKEESKGVMALIETIIKDLEKEDLELTGEEKGAQSMYEKFMADAAEKRATMSKASVDKESALAETETDVMTAKDSLKGKKGEVMDLGKYVSSLHGECDWLLKYHDTRAAARTGEIESLDKAKAVLSGADYSLIQVEPSVHLRGALRA
mmetsp:Transcript_114837/g.203442  ORF Transcript_114837/g.203442 Transcript_114837/m.203442 type:complete len:691 (+) Transcript_114837:63-2135(+)